MVGPETLPVPAVVVGGADNCGGLGIVRSLAHANIPIFVLDTAGSAPALYSRYARKVLVSAVSGPQFVRELLTLQSALQSRPVLFLTSDDAALTVSEFRSELEAAYRLRLPSHQRLTELMQKNTFEQVATELNFPVPRSMRIRTLNDLSNLAGLNAPLVVKPSVKSELYLKHQFERGYRVSSLKEAEAVCRRILPILPDLIVQEWIEGTDDELYFCLQYRGEAGARVAFSGRKLSIWPPEIGTTASCTAAPQEDAELTGLTDRFFDAVAFTGMGGMEFKRDSRTGRFFMIEPTVGRVDWQEEVATLNGVNIPVAAYRHEIGEPLPARTLAPPVIWRDGARHWKAVRAGHACKAPAAAVVDAYWRLNDPLPAIFHAFTTLARTVRRFFDRFRIPAGVLSRSH
jgi:D-aspartate ligase